jgi:hypothetical protein
MSVLAVAVVLGQLAAAAPAVGDGPILTLNDRSEARVRTRVLGAGVAADVDTLPVAALILKGRRTDLVLAYGAHAAQLDVFQQPTFIIAHSARIGVGYQRTRRLRWTASADGAIGKQFSDGLVAQPNLGPATTPTPTPTAVAFRAPVPVLNSLSYRAELGFGYRLARRWDLSSAASYGGGQGLDAASRLTLPPYYGPTGYVTAGYTASRDDRIATSVGVSYTVSPTVGSEFFNAAVFEAWTHTFGERTTGFAGIGVSWQLAHAKRGVPETSTYYPDAELGATHTIPLDTAETLTFREATRLGLRYDAVLRTSAPQVSTVASAVWSSPHVGASLTAEAMTTLPSDPPEPLARQVSGSVVTWYSPTRFLRFETGARAYLQDLPVGLAGVANQANTIQWAAFVAVAIQAPAIEL